MNPHLIAITGGSGAGKTWLAQRLLEEFGEQAGRISLDDFYRDLSHLPMAGRELVNFDEPSAIDWPLFRQTIAALRTGAAVALPDYDFSTHTRRAESKPWQPRPLVLLDGLWLFHEADLRDQYSFRIFVDQPEALRLARRMERDQRQRSRSAGSVFAQFRRQVAPMHDLYVGPQIHHADVVVNSTSGAILSHLQALIGRLLKTNKLP